MFSEFRRRYPLGALIGELVRIDHGKYIVLVRVENEGRILATGLAAADTIEAAEDRARERAIAPLAAQTAEIISQTTPNSPVNGAPPREKTITTPAIEPLDETALLPTRQAITQVEPPAREPEPEPEPIPPAPPKKSSKSSKITRLPVPDPEPPEVVKIPEPEPEPEPLGLDLEGDNDSLYPDEVILSREEEPEEIPVLSREEEPEELSREEEPEEIPALSREEEPEEIPTPPPPITLPPEEIDYSVLKTKIDVEMKRLGWTTEKGRDYLISTYGKKSRLLLTNEELLEFYNYLSSI